MSISQRIFDFLAKIPKDRVSTYKILANTFHIHPRAVARILASNTDQERYPCYKIICSDGKIGGYNLGTAEKIRKLQADGIDIINNTISDKHIRNPLDNTA